MREKIIYKVFGPFMVPKMASGQPDFEPDAKNAFWEKVDQREGGLSRACGCYVISVRKKVWYVGLAQAQDFEHECFSADKQVKFFKATAEGGNAYLHLVARTTPGGRFAMPGCHKDIKELEGMLIMVALRRNTHLLNKGRTKFLRSVVVPGILNSPQGHGRALSVQSLGKVLGVSESNSVKRHVGEEIGDYEAQGGFDGQDEPPVHREGPSALTLAIQVLKDRENKPIGRKELLEKVLALGWKTEGMYPDHTIRVEIEKEIHRKGKDSRFARGEKKGTFMLTEIGLKE